MAKAELEIYMIPELVQMVWEYADSELKDKYNIVMWELNVKQRELFLFQKIFPHKKILSLTKLPIPSRSKYGVGVSTWTSNQRDSIHDKILNTIFHCKVCKRFFNGNDEDPCHPDYAEYH